MNRMTGAAFLGVLLIGAVLAGSAWRSCGFQGCPDPQRLVGYQPDALPLLLDRHGEVLGALHPLEGEVVELETLPEYLAQAFVAVEDRRFHRHRGVDWRRVVSAAAGNVASGGIREGGSTLTMQLARTLFSDRIPGTERTLRRKLLEARTAGRIERTFSKDEILELYLNHVYVGAGAYGVAAGARYYFGRPPSELTLEQAALLAGIVRAPGRLDPRRHPEAARSRRDLVLALMEREGTLSREEADQARSQAPEVAPEPPVGASVPAPYFVEAVRRLLDDLLDPAAYASAIRIHTTVDRAVQIAAEEELLRQLEAVEGGAFGPWSGPRYGDALAGRSTADTDYLQGAVVVLEASTGDVLALVGGRDYGDSRFNRALYAYRQVGSAFKPFVFAAALSRGYVASQPLADEPFTVELAGSGPWSPRNYDGTFRGAVSMRRALVESLNVPTVRLGMSVGMDEVARMAMGVGFTESVPEVPAATLGTTTASPLQMAVTYAVFAGGGERPVPRFITRVETSEGRELYAAPARLESGMDPRIAHIVDDFLRDAVEAGTGRSIRSVGYAGPASGKTGTTQDAHDAWFVGYAGDVVAAVWIGFDRPRPIFPGATGGGVAAPIWGRTMARLPEGRILPSGAARPPGVVERPVDPSTGRILGEGCSRPEGGAVLELFLEEFQPVEACPPEAPGLVGRVVGFFRGLRGGTPEEPEPTTAPDPLLGAERVPLARGSPTGPPPARSP